VNQLDSPPTRLDDLKDMKFAWCVGYIQATEERISDWRTAAAIQIMAYQKNGEPTPSHMWADEDFVSTCIPDEAPIAQLTRVIVKWLREHPERLHDLKSFLVMDALKNAFPCPGTPKEAAKPTSVKH
jgi:hypothetical protein